MRILVQRVKRADLFISGERHCSIGGGMVALAGVEAADTLEDAAYLARKLARLRIFDDREGVMNLDVRQTGGEVMLVSQFTLYASTRHGNRPSYVRAAAPTFAEPMFGQLVEAVERECGRRPATGVFGAHMEIELVNDGPVTIWIDSKLKE